MNQLNFNALAKKVLAAQNKASLIRKAVLTFPAGEGDGRRFNDLNAFMLMDDKERREELDADLEEKVKLETLVESNTKDIKQNRVLILKKYEEAKGRRPSRLPTTDQTFKKVICVLLTARFEVLVNGEWGTICDDGFSNTEAQVACRDLGYPAEGASSFTCGYYDNRCSQGQGNIWMNAVYCNGDEATLLLCDYTRNHNCDHFEDVGISCSTG